MEHLGRDHTPQFPMKTRPFRGVYRDPMRGMQFSAIRMCWTLDPDKKGISEHFLEAKKKNSWFPKIKGYIIQTLLLIT